MNECYTTPEYARQVELEKNYVLRRKIQLLPRQLEPILRKLQVTGTPTNTACEDAIADIIVIREIVDEMFHTGMNEISKHAEEMAKNK